MSHSNAIMMTVTNKNYLVPAENNSSNSSSSFFLWNNNNTQWATHFINCAGLPTWTTWQF